MRSIIEYAVQHRVTILMAACAALLFGVVALGRLPVQLLPEITYPSLTIQTEYPDSAPSEVENLITRPLEEAVGVVPGLRRLHSVSQPGLSEITLEFSWDTSMDFAALDVREKMDQVLLPDDARAPVLLRYDPALDPTLRLGLSGETNLVHLRHLADQVIKKELESVRGVAAAKVLGGLQEEIHVDVDENRLAALGVPIENVARVVGEENVNAAGGRLRDRDAQYIVRTLNQYEGPEDIAETIVLRDGKRVVKLGDVAEVTRSWKEREIVTRIDGNTAVEVAIYKEGDANLVQAADRVKARLPQLRSMLPEGVELQLLSDQSTYISAAVGQVQSNAMLGGALAVLVLLIFLRDFRSTAIIALSIPTSIIATFILMYKQGLSLNVMSLGGLALGVGMLVDNSIVVLESIVRHRREDGGSREEAVINGAEEVAPAVTASTLTTIAVFLPIFFVEGIARQIFRDQALTVTYSLMVSLVVALTLTPMLAALGREGSIFPWRRKRAVALSSDEILANASAKVTANANAELPTPPGALDTLATSRIQRAYGRLLNGALSRRPAVMASVIVLFALAIFSGRQLGSDLIPPLSQGQLRFAVELPEGTPLEQSDHFMDRLEREMAEIEGVSTVYANVGVDAGKTGGLRTKKESSAELNLRLDDRLDPQGQERVLDQVRAVFAEHPRAEAELLRATNFTFRTPVAVEIYGYDLDDLDEISSQVMTTLNGIEGLSDVGTTVEEGSPEVQIRFDRDKLRAAGLDLRGASEALRIKILGRVATDYKDRDRQIDVLVRSADAQDLDYNELRNMVIGHHETMPVRLASVADLSIDRGPARITRLSQARAVVVRANLSGRDLGSVSTEIEEKLRQLPLPAGVTLQMGGQSDEMGSSMRSLRFAIALAIFLVYLVMASQFESLLDPFLILLTVPTALIGVVAALRLTGEPVSVVVMIGAIMLAGIVVNNGIVLVDLIGQLRRKGLALREALVRAGQVRLRPILMTTTTTVLGLTPMALGRGQGAEIGAPLAVTVIGGLLVATLLTLVVIPVLYSFVHREA